ncbi:MAG: DinB family protein [Blastocatellia bacterium]|nr:DinB family protein [Blastocatellia bacterium]
MTLREFYLERLKAEVPVFLRVLKAVPKDQLSYKPHERSPSAEQLVWTITAEQRACLDVVDEYKTEWKNIPTPPLEEMLEKYEQWSDELIKRVSQVDEESWDRMAQFYYEGKVVFEQQLGAFLWFILFDTIHHRGQLSAYLRPMGSKVPSIYGPSADEPASM